MASTVIDVIVVGLAAIASDVELDCKVMAPSKAPASEIHVIALDPGWPMKHEPWLAVRVDALRSAPDECFLDNLTTIPADCTSQTDKKWAKYNMRGKQLRIDQPLDNKANVLTGERKVNGYCWEGTRPSATSCRMDDEACRRDASWIPEYSKVVGNGLLDPRFIEAPEAHPIVSAIAPGLRGQLEAFGEISLVWNWMWSHADCQGAVPDYRQRFSARAAIQDIVSVTQTIRLVELKTFGSIAIDLKPSMTALKSAQVMIYSAPASEPHLVKVDGTKCPIPHFDALNLLIADPPECRRIPYYVVGANEACDIGLNLDDPICPPVHVRFGHGR